MHHWDCPNNMHQEYSNSIISWQYICMTASSKLLEKRSKSALVVDATEKDTYVFPTTKRQVQDKYMQPNICWLPSYSGHQYGGNPTHNTTGSFPFDTHKLTSTENLRHETHVPGSSRPNPVLCWYLPRIPHRLQHGLTCIYFSLVLVLITCILTG